MTTNDNLLKKIYEDVIIHESGAVRITRRVDKEVKSLMSPYASKMDGKEQENFEDMCYDISHAAQFGGFCIGVKYAMKILAEILRE